MRPDIRSLREFYGTRLGRWVRNVLAHKVLDRWSNTRGDVILGIGYATPLLRLLLRQSGSSGVVLAGMPRAQGGLYWPSRGDNRTVLVHEDALPMPANTVHRVVLLHALEFAEDPKALLREVWRVLTPGGRAMMYVPNRRSIWSGAQGTPFGYGTPYSIAQLRHLLEDTGLTVMHCDTVLYAPPLQWTLVRKLAPVLEVLGFLLPFSGGVIAMEVEKQIYAGIRETKRKNTPAVVWIPAGVSSSSRSA
jgi:hypothetical protein